MVRDTRRVWEIGNFSITEGYDQRGALHGNITISGSGYSETLGNATISGSQITAGNERYTSAGGQITVERETVPGTDVLEQTIQIATTTLAGQTIRVTSKTNGSGVLTSATYINETTGRTIL